MKVYVLVNGYTGDTEGVFTAAGKEAKEKELFAAACARLHEHVVSLEADKAVYRKQAGALYAAAGCLPIEANAEKVFGLLKEKDELLNRARDTEREIDLICNLVKAEVLEQYGFGHMWQVFELLDD